MIVYLFEAVGTRISGGANFDRQLGILPSKVSAVTEKMVHSWLTKNGPTGPILVTWSGPAWPKMVQVMSSALMDPRWVLWSF